MNASRTLEEILADETSEFGAAVAAVLTADVSQLATLLGDCKNLPTARSQAPHASTLLHYVALNGIEDELQLHPQGVYRQLASGTAPAGARERAVEVPRLLIQAGAEVDAGCGTYGGGELQTPMNLLVSSGHPASAGVLPELVSVFCRFAGAGGFDHIRIRA